MEQVISGVHHIALKCSDSAEFQRTLKFYTEVLGLPCRRSWGEGDGAGAMLTLGGSLMEIFASGKVAGSTGSVNHFALAVADVDGLVAKIRAAGYAITREPTDIAIPSEPPFPARIAFCVGPVGEEIELFCEK